MGGISDMNQDFEVIRAGIDRYCHAVHTQQAKDFLPLWAAGVEIVLISPGGCHVGTQNIYDNFLVGTIRRLYTKIDLIADDVMLRQVGEDTIIAVFAYHTECIRRDDGSDFGIAGLETQVWVRQAEDWRLAHIHYSKQ